MAMPVRELELDLEAFEGPFDLLLALVLRDELDLGEVDVAGIVLAFLERLAEREELDLDACGEFLVLVAALLELKARALLTGE
jgi:segregation and condensation protein A